MTSEEARKFIFDRAPEEFAGKLLTEFYQISNNIIMFSNGKPNYSKIVDELFITWGIY